MSGASWQTQTITGGRRALLLAVATVLFATTAGCRGVDQRKRLEDWHYHWGDLPTANSASYENASWKPLQRGAGARQPSGRRLESVLWLRARLPALKQRDPTLYIGSIEFAGEVYLDGQCIHSFRRVGVPEQGRFAGHRWHIVPLQHRHAGKQVYFRCYSLQPDRIGLRRVGVVSRAAFLERMVHRGVHFFVLGLIFVLIGLFALSAYGMGRRDKVYAAFGMFSLCVGVMTFFDNRIAQLFASAIGPWYALLQTLPFVALVGSCVLFESIFGLGRHRLVRRIWQVLLVAGALHLLLRLTLWLPPRFDPLLSRISAAVLALAMVGLLAVAIRAALSGQSRSLAPSSQWEAKIFALGYGAFGVLLLYELVDLDGLLGLPPDLYPWGMVLFLGAVASILERRFRASAVELAEKNAELLDYSRTLEQKVQERTHDLDEKNAELAAVNRSLETLVAERTQQLVDQEKTAIIGRMIQGIAHNLKTPLAVVKSANALVAKKAEKAIADPAIEGLAARALKQLRSLPGDSELVEKAHAQITAMIDTLMLKSRLDHRPETTPIDLNELLRHVLEFFLANPQFKHEVKKTIELADELPRLSLVATNITQVIENLVNNALDAMWKSERKELLFRTRQDDEAIYLEIGDSGSGIPPEKVQRIFDPFYTSKPPKGEGQEGEPAGTGLGLHTCVELLRPFGGELSVRSEVDVGSTFTIRLPKDPPELECSRAASESAVDST